MAHRNRWFTELNSMVIFHGYVSHNQRVPIIDSSIQRKHLIRSAWLSMKFPFLAAHSSGMSHGEHVTQDGTKSHSENDGATVV